MKIKLSTLISLIESKTNKKLVLQKHVLKEAANTGFISFPTTSQAALFQYEILGQLSDGMWENTKPYDHWKFWNNLDIKTGGIGYSTGQYRQKSSGYNLGGLIPHVGDRMLCIGRMGKVTKDPKILSSAEYLEGFTTIDNVKAASGYSKKYIDSIPDDILNKYFSTTYTMSDLKKDLAIINKSMNTRAGSSTPNIKPDDKDYQRIRDIISKTDDKNKRIALATQMANAIKDPVKAQARGMAAEYDNYHEIAKIFFTKAEQLGFN